MAQRLTEAERSALHTNLPAWGMAEGRDAIRREFRFKDFSQAWGFMARVALLAGWFVAVETSATEPTVPRQ